MIHKRSLVLLLFIACLGAVLAYAVYKLLNYVGV